MINPVRAMFLPDNLSSLKDDMTAFIEGHGMKRYFGLVSEEIPNVAWESADNPDGWKDFVELAKGAGSTFLTMNAAELEKEELDFLIERLRNANYPNDEDIEEALWLRTYVGKVGSIQIGWPHQGVMFLYEVATEWYERYQRLMETSEDFGGIVFDEPDQEE
jgi:hypothetical protein